MRQRGDRGECVRERERTPRERGQRARTERGKVGGLEREREKRESERERARESWRGGLTRRRRMKMPLRLLSPLSLTHPYSRSERVKERDRAREKRERKREAGRETGVDTDMATESWQGGLTRMRSLAGLGYGVYGEDVGCNM